MLEISKFTQVLRNVSDCQSGPKLTNFRMGQIRDGYVFLLTI